MLSDGPKSNPKTQLGPGTAEFAQLEYSLQLVLNASTARVVAAFAVSNPHQALQFERRSKVVVIYINSHS